MWKRISSKIGSKISRSSRPSLFNSLGNETNTNSNAFLNSRQSSNLLEDNIETLNYSSITTHIREEANLKIQSFLQRLYELMNMNGVCFLKGAFVIELSGVSLQEINSSKNFRAVNSLKNSLAKNLLLAKNIKFPFNALKSHTVFIQHKITETPFFEIYFNPLLKLRCQKKNKKAINNSNDTIDKENLKFYFFESNGKTFVYMKLEEAATLTVKHAISAFKVYKLKKSRNNNNHHNHHNSSIGTKKASLAQTVSKKMSRLLTFNENNQASSSLINNQNNRRNNRRNTNKIPTRREDCLREGCKCLGSPENLKNCQWPPDFKWFNSNQSFLLKEDRNNQHIRAGDEFFVSKTIADKLFEMVENQKPRKNSGYESSGSRTPSTSNESNAFNTPSASGATGANSKF